MVTGDLLRATFHHMSTASVKLTKQAIDNAKPAPARYVLWDNELRGFGVRIEPSSLSDSGFAVDRGE